MYVTTKGQVTIPMEVRDRLEIYAHSEIEFIEENGKFYIQKVENRESGKNRFHKFRGSATVKMATDEIMSLTRNE